MTAKPHDEDRLVERLKTGSPEALKEAYGQYGEMVYQLSYSMTHSAADASDVLHEVFVGLPEAVRSFEGRGSLGAWIRSVAIRTTLMKHRKRRLRREVSLRTLLEPGRSRGRDDGGPVDKLALERALSRLPTKLRAVFVLKEVEGYTHAEIAELLEIRRNTSEVRLYRARRLLRDYLTG